MGNKFFGVDIAKEVHAAFRGQVLPATLHKATSGARTAGSLTAGRARTETDYPCEGFVEEYADRHVDGKIVKKGDRKVSLFGESISSGTVVPEPGDSITIEGTRRKIVKDGVGRDPAKAVYECQCR